MQIQESIVNKVAQSGLVSIDLAAFYPEGERVLYDIKDNLFHGLMLRERDFREFVKDYDWSVYTGKHMAIICSADAIVPTWAYMLLAVKMAPFALSITFGDLNTLETVLFQQKIKALDIEKYRDQRVVIKGCGDVDVPVSAFVSITERLSGVAKSIMYGEPCSTVPIYKRKD
ncbi:MAG: DUF2480 family protein [Flavobacterium sp.]|nr:DUF2480 family protein [Pedobacter sp.]